MRRMVLPILIIPLLVGCVSLSDPWKVAAGQSEGFEMQGPKVTRLTDGGMQCEGTADDPCTLKAVKGGPLSDGLVGMLSNAISGVLGFFIRGG